MTSSPFSLDRRDALTAGLSATALALAGPVARAQVAPQPRRSWLLADGWRFHLGHAADPARDFGFGQWQRTYAKPGADVAEAALASFDDSAWEAVRVPHDWAVSLPFAPPASVPKDKEDFAAAHGFHAIGRDFPQNSIGWYRCRLPLEAVDRSRSVWLEFDGVFRASLVMVNGYVAGGSESGYAPFRVDITDFLNTDGTPDQLALRVDASLGEGWFYEGAGIYRHVRLVSADPVHVPQWGVWVRAAPRGRGASVTVETTCANSASTPASVVLRHQIAAPDGAIVARGETGAFPLGAGQELVREQGLDFASARLWSPMDPALYSLATEIVVDGRVIDRVVTPFGVRSIRFDAAQGFFLNDQPVKLLGVCNHQDHAGVGTAMPDALVEWRVARMQDMGANAWRSAHNPPAQSLLDICDRRGMMMIAETRANTTSAEALDQMDRMIRSSRNHPCVILWSVGNEEVHEGAPRGRRISSHLVRQVRKLDPTRPTIQALDQGWYEDGAARAVDVVGFNYRTEQIAAFHAKFPDVPVIGTETASTVATRGVYTTDATAHVLRAYDTEHPWWASTAEAWWTIAADSPYIAGGFIWTGFDYRGEPTPYPSWPSVGSNFGAADSCGFPKDNYWYYRSWWRRDVSQVHLLPHWTWPGREGQPIEVWVHGNCATVALSLNGRPLGRKPMPRNGHLVWQVPYAPGELVAEGFDAKGQHIATDRRVTASAPAGLTLDASRVRLAADGADVAMIAAQVVDRAGHPVPTAATRLNFRVEGPGRILGTGNGDPNDHDPDHAPARKAFNGLAQVIVQTTGSEGAITLVATGEGLSPARITLFAHRPA